ncbi:MAG: hypothetical protein QM500_13225 [Methylococcales bacterium]
MNILPSQNEKIITVSIVSICIGLIIGLIFGANINDKNILITSLATLSAAFFGAWLSYKLQDNNKKIEQTKKQVQNANDLLFSIYQKLNALIIFQRDFVDPWRDKPERIIAMEPIIDYRLPLTKIIPENINFLLGTKYAKLLFETHIEDERFKVAEDIIKFRSNLHLNKVQPAIHSAGIAEGDVFDSIQLKSAIGEMLYIQLQKSTDSVIFNVDRTVESSKDLGDRLLLALKETFPNEEFVKFILLEESV